MTEKYQQLDFDVSGLKGSLETVDVKGRRGRFVFPTVFEDRKGKVNWSVLGELARRGKAILSGEDYDHQEPLDI